MSGSLLGLRDVGSDADFQEFLAGLPYVKLLGVRGERRGDELTLTLPFAPHLVGNTRLPALHGGAIGAFLETAAVLQLMWEIESAHLPKAIDLTFNYLRSGRPLDTYARASISKLGRRVANVSVAAWQEDRQRPIATANGNFLLASDAAVSG